jgi:hypothetical protein
MEEAISFVMTKGLELGAGRDIGRES